MKVIKFQSAWCGPCQGLTMTLKGMDIRIPVELVDIDKQTDVATTYGIRSIPTMILVDENDNQIRRLSGNASVDKIKEFLGEYC